MLTPGELVREIRQAGLVRDQLPVKKWVRLSEDEHALIKAVARALQIPETQAIRALLLRGMMDAKKLPSG
jgi:hypothetical protein